MKGEAFSDQNDFFLSFLWYDNLFLLMAVIILHRFYSNMVGKALIFKSRVFFFHLKEEKKSPWKTVRPVFANVSNIILRKKLIDHINTTLITCHNGVPAYFNWNLWIKVRWSAEANRTWQNILPFHSMYQYIVSHSEDRTFFSSYYLSMRSLYKCKRKVQDYSKKVCLAD